METNGNGNVLYLDKFKKNKNHVNRSLHGRDIAWAQMVVSLIRK